MTTSIVKKANQKSILLPTAGWETKYENKDFICCHSFLAFCTMLFNDHCLKYHTHWNTNSACHLTISGTSIWSNQNRLWSQTTSETCHYVLSLPISDAFFWQFKDAYFHNFNATWKNGCGNVLNFKESCWNKPTENDEALLFP